MNKVVWQMRRRAPRTPIAHAPKWLFGPQHYCQSIVSLLVFSMILEASARELSAKTSRFPMPPLLSTGPAKSGTRLLRVTHMSGGGNFLFVCYALFLDRPVAAIDSSQINVPAVNQGIIKTPSNLVESFFRFRPFRALHGVAMARVEAMLFRLHRALRKKKSRCPTPSTSISQRLPLNLFSSQSPVPATQLSFPTRFPIQFQHLLQPQLRCLQRRFPRPSHHRLRPRLDSL